MSMTVTPPRQDGVVLVGEGPAEFSTSMEVQSTAWKMDVNGYYRALGVSVFATRKEIGEAYKALDGHSSIRLTMIVKTLLDPDERARYDRVPLGSLYLDQEVEDQMNTASQAAASEGIRTGAITYEQVYGDRREDPLDPVSAIRQSAPNRLDRYRQTGSWSHYLWDTERCDAEILSQWRGALAHVLRGRGGPIAVGFHAGTGSPVEVTRIGYRIVCFLADGEQPTEANAQAAASRVHTHTAP